MAQGRKRHYFKLDKKGLDAFLNSPQVLDVVDEAGAMFEQLLGDRSEARHGRDKRARTYVMGKTMDDSIVYRRARAYDAALGRFPVSATPPKGREGGR